MVSNDSISELLPNGASEGYLDFFLIEIFQTIRNFAKWNARKQMKEVNMILDFSFQGVKQYKVGCGIRATRFK